MLSPPLTPSSRGSLSSDPAEFAARFPAFAGPLDVLRATEFSRLDATGHTYLDYTGGGLYPSSLLNEHFKLLQESVLGNPHSNNPTSRASTELVEEARRAVFEFFDGLHRILPSFIHSTYSNACFIAFFAADQEEYTVIFTANASNALKLVGESYPFGQGSRYLVSGDNHNSCNVKCLSDCSR